MLKPLPSSNVARYAISSAALFVAVLICGNALAVDADADWQARKTAPGVFYSEGFDYGSKAELVNAAINVTDEAPRNGVDVDANIKLSGSKSLKLITYGAAGPNGGSWADFYDNGSGTTKYKRFYFQVAMYLPRDMLAYRWKGGDGQLKLVNLEQYGAGQVVVTNRKFLGFPSMLINGTSTIERKIAENVVPNVSSEYVFQPAVDTGSPASPADACEFWSRYGPARGIAINDNYSYSTTEPYLDRRGFAQGWPNRCALKSGVPYNIDGWTVVEVFVDYNVSNPGASTIQAWAAPYGEKPRLFINEVGTASLNSNDNVYRRFELLNYDTPREAEADRPTLYTYFDEVIISTEPIRFPGGYELSDLGTVSDTTVPPPPPPSSPPPPESSGTGPDWVTAIPEGTWAAISSNTLSAFDPEKDAALNPNYPSQAPWHGSTGQKSVLNSWNGGAYASKLGTQGSLIVYGGGHKNYYGNEVYAFDLASKKWRRLTNPYPGPIEFPYPRGRYPDGTPVPAHMYDQLEYHPGSNSFVALRAMTDNLPSAVGIAYLLDLGTLKWRWSPEHAENCHATGGWSLYDPSRDVIWAEGGSGSSVMCRFDPNVKNGDGTYGKWTDFPSQVPQTDSVGAYDPVRDLALVTAFRNDTAVFAIDLRNPENRKVRLAEAGDPPAKEPRHGWDWSELRQAFIYWRRDGGVYEFRLNGPDWKTGPWTWTRITSPDNRLAPQDMDVDNGIYGRFRVVRLGDTEVGIVVNRVDGPVYAFRIPEGDFTRPEPPAAVNVE